MRPKRSLGQNFLVDPNTQRRIVDALEAGPDDTVIEIGPGRGALTHHLAERAGRLFAIELDDHLADELTAAFDHQDHVTIIHADALDVDLARLVAEPEQLRVIGNIPYNITTPLLFHLLETRPPPAAILLMVQDEVADRIIAEPGNRTYGALSVGTRAAARVDRLFRVGRGAFRPRPDVDSAVLRFVPHHPPLASHDEHDLRSLTRAAFGKRRKQLQKILRTDPDYHLSSDDIARLQAETGFDLTARPETLSPDEFLRLSRALRAMHRPRTTV